MSRQPLNIVLTFAAVALLAPALRADTFGANGNVGSVAAITKDITVDEHAGARLPLDLTFVDDNGQTVRLGDYFKGNKPVVLQLGYYGCPMLCNVISQGIVESLKDVKLETGSDYDVLFVSIDPSETPKLAAEKKQSMLAAFGREGGSGWHLLTGKEPQIRQLAQTVGFTYRWIDSAGQYAHPAVIMVCMPDGKVSRYLYGVRFNPQTLRLSLVEASDGKVGSAVDKLYLTCFQYDGRQGKYALAAIGIMRGGGVLTMVVVAIVLFRMFRKEARQRAQEQSQDNPRRAALTH
jgi:protein SCO1/2